MADEIKTERQPITPPETATPPVTSEQPLTPEEKIAKLEQTVAELRAKTPEEKLRRASEAVKRFSKAMEERINPLIEKTEKARKALNNALFATTVALVLISPFSTLPLDALYRYGHIYIGSGDVSISTNYPDHPFDYESLGEYGYTFNRFTQADIYNNYVETYKALTGETIPQGSLRAHNFDSRKTVILPGVINPDQEEEVSQIFERANKEGRSVSYEDLKFILDKGNNPEYSLVINNDSFWDNRTIGGTLGKIGQSLSNGGYDNERRKAIYLLTYRDWTSPPGVSDHVNTKIFEFLFVDVQN